MLTMTSGEGASAFFTDVDRNVSPENPDLGKSSPASQRALGRGSHFPPR